MKKKYLKTVEDVLALKDTDTKIYDSSYNETDTHYEFVNGVLCRFDTNGGIKFNDSIYLKAHNHYILEEETMQEATEEDVGKLCWFWGSNDKNRELGVLESVNCDEDEIKYASDDGFCYHHCRRLSPAEAAEITGYKVEKAE